MIRKCGGHSVESLHPPRIALNARAQIFSAEDAGLHTRAMQDFLGHGTGQLPTPISSMKRFRKAADTAPDDSVARERFLRDGARDGETSLGFASLPSGPRGPKQFGRLPLTRQFGPAGRAIDNTAPPRAVRQRKSSRSHAGLRLWACTQQIPRTDARQ